MTTRFVRSFCILAAFVASACGGKRLCVAPGQNAEFGELRSPQDFHAAITEALLVAPAAPVDILALSGGGQWGAFGAGFMKGWSDRGDRPSFRVVNGTSTGSLISTFAFLGPAHDDALRDAYLGIRGDRDIFRNHFPLNAILFKPSLSTTNGLHTRLKGSMTPERVAAVAAEGKQGRKLFVGAVDLDSGDFAALDLTRIAGGVNARDEYVDALMASTAIPVKFPPRYRKGTLFVDGGARRNIFVEQVIREVGELKQTGAAVGKATIYCVVNGVRGVSASCPAARIPAIAGRSVDVLFDETTEGNLLRVYLQAQRAGMEFRMVSIDPNACSAQLKSSKENQFDPILMKCLYEHGRAKGSSASPWTSDPL